MRQNDKEEIKEAASGETKLTHSKRYTRNSEASERDDTRCVMAKAIKRIRLWVGKTYSGPLAKWSNVSNVKSSRIANAMQASPTKESEMKDFLNQSTNNNILGLLSATSKVPRDDYPVSNMLDHFQIQLNQSGLSAEKRIAIESISLTDKEINDLFAEARKQADHR